MDSEDAIAHLKAYIEEQEVVGEVLSEAVREGFRNQLTAETDMLVLRAQTAWDAGLPFLSISFSDGRPTQGRKEWPALRDDFRAINEANWSNALARITAIGWLLHTWIVVERESRIVPAPLFERPGR